MIDVMFFAGVGLATVFVFITVYYVIKKTLAAKYIKDN